MTASTPYLWLFTVGLEQAIAHYGAPIERQAYFTMGQEFMAYWSHVGRQRDAEVVLAAECPGGGFLLHTKREYPAGVYRLCTGGIRRGEDILEAVARELKEETGLQGEILRFLGILTSRFEGEGQVIPFISYVFHLRLEEGYANPEDASEGILGFRRVNLQGLNTVADELAALDEKGPFWGDWGRFRAGAHRLVVEALAPTYG